MAARATLRQLRPGPLRILPLQPLTPMVWLQAVALGNTTITATDSGMKQSTTLTVSNRVVSSITISPANGTVTSGGTQQFTATATFSDNTTQDVTTSATWSSSNTAAATITTTGLVTGITTGTTTITATFSGVTASTTLTVQ